MSEYDVTIHDQGDLARIAELEALSNTSICIFCGKTMAKDLTVMLKHAAGCDERPENRLMVRIAELETNLTALKKLYESRREYIVELEQKLDRRGDLTVLNQQGVRIAELRKQNDILATARLLEESERKHAEATIEQLKTALVAIQSTTPGSAHRIAIQALAEKGTP